MLKKVLLVLMVLFLLTACSEPVYETLGNVVHVGGNPAQPRQVLLSFPEDASLLTMSGEERLYLCDGYTMTLQNCDAGDLGATVLWLTGKKLTDITMLETVCGDHKRKDFVWITNTEEGQQVCRGAILDDGVFHYCLTVMAPGEDAVDLRQTWNALFSSFCLETIAT